MKTKTIDRNEIYRQEFNLNMKNQVRKLKEPMVVGYSPDMDIYFYTIIIPNIFLPFKKTKWKE